MKRGELIILWVGGLLSVGVLGLSDLTRLTGFRGFDSPGIGVVLGRALDTLGTLASIWILCGLVWATAYKRERRKREDS